MQTVIDFDLQQSVEKVMLLVAIRPTKVCHSPVYTNIL